MTTRQEKAEGVGHVRYTYRLRVSATALAALEAEWGRCRWIWNECVAKSRQRHIANRTRPDSSPKLTCGPAELDKMLTEARATLEWLREGASVPQQQTIRDFAQSRAKAIKDIKTMLPARQRTGMPRHKRLKDARPSLNYTKRGFRLKDGRLHLAGGIALTVVWSRELPVEPSSVRVYRDTLGHWYASFVVPAKVEPLPATGAVIGIDWGVKETAITTSDAHDLSHSECGRKAAAALAKYQRRMARRRPPKGKPASKGYRRAQRQAAKLQKKVARQRQDTGRKWAKAVARDHDHIAVEDFRPRFLAKTTMAKKAADAAISATKTSLLEMARKHGRTVHLIHSAHTTMDCSNCGARAKHRMLLSVRTYTCTACGFSSPRDKNSARVMLVRAGLIPVGVECVRRGCP
ncbi:RNA-guided endonuclease TnpB family protein [Streptomyces sp. FH025]|uniref:RNA-guided endonuclease InsQ/TnpB family protein n=1 Tax=Streptomyces sp. FH025 TaxID=2815937 RepID=UPI001A9DC687|nr:RNA-guided endonuclease TnpB family protein [Streptomyces sp. FH025]MBO1416934.1 transposase [Streptomyces sp. FH025]